MRRWRFFSKISMLFSLTFASLVIQSQSTLQGNNRTPIATCGLARPAGNVVPLSVTAEATSSFAIRVRLSSAPVGAYTVLSTGLRSTLWVHSFNTANNPGHSATSPAPVGIFVHEPVLPGSHYDYIVKGVLGNGKTGCGEASATTPPAPLTANIVSQYVSPTHVNLSFVLPPYVHEAHLYQGTAIDPGHKVLDFMLPGANYAGGQGKLLSDLVVDPGRPSIPAGMWRPMSYPLVLEIIWTTRPDGTGARVSVVQPIVVAAPPLVRGFADIHNHQFANLAFGGHFLVGSPFGPIDTALSSDSDRSFHGSNHSNDTIGENMGDNGVPVTLTTSFAPSLPLAAIPNAGFPDFSGWPGVREIDHQKVYEDWLKRAVDAGLRLMVMFAEDSPPLCNSVGNDGRDCNDQAATIQMQLDSAFEMQNSIDMRAGGPGQGWYRIVDSPAQARAVIGEGRLAVVLGVETVNPPLIAIPRGALWLRSHHVRHVFPIHVANNDFGGASYFQPALQRQTNAPLNPTPILDQNWFSEKYDITTRPCPQYELNGGVCNALGLSATGKSAIKELMRAGLIVDVDHLSDMSFSDTLDIAEERKYPVVASHAGFSAVNHHLQSHEGQLTGPEYSRILNTGGMVGLITGQGKHLNDVGTNFRLDNPLAPKPFILHGCGRSSETFAQAYFYAIDNSLTRTPIALGTDFGGPLLQPGPRFGPIACLGGGSPTVTAKLNYPFLARGSGITMGQMQLGARNIDFNNEGLVTVGQLPDFIADLESIGVTTDELEPLFYSADAYITMWERAEEAARMEREMTVTIDYGKESALRADVSQSFTVNAFDTYWGTALDRGVIYIGSEKVGSLGSPITRTFHSFHGKLPSIVIKVKAARFIDGVATLRVAR
jgi:microsomal dipeptidase-like Zn-dependent dipeptidase